MALVAALAMGFSTQVAQQAVYFGDGCFWHTQYDMYVAEMASPFNRNLQTITARTGYAGSDATPPTGQVCYHNGPANTFYGLPEGMGFAEAVQVIFDADVADSSNRSLLHGQFGALANKFFESFDCTSGQCIRGDPQDAGADYRNIVGIPGGITGELYPILVNHNVHNMTLVKGRGGLHGDEVDEGTIYVYDTTNFPFYRAEQYHQYHLNRVLNRPLPPEYVNDAKTAAIGRGWINKTCDEQNTDTNTSNLEVYQSFPIFGTESIMTDKGTTGSCFANVQTTLRWGVDRDLADRIACQNRIGAERAGYFLGTGFVDAQQDQELTIFYDSVSGKPLFKAPVNRTWDEFLTESTHHGWPSFRDEEVYWENVRVLDSSGETVSVDGTHLGHNIPDGQNRYCIDLVSIAGGNHDLITCYSTSTSLGVGTVVGIAMAVVVVALVVAAAYFKLPQKLLGMETKSSKYSSISSNPTYNDADADFSADIDDDNLIGTV